MSANRFLSINEQLYSFTYVVIWMVLLNTSYFFPLNPLGQEPWGYEATLIQI